MMTCNKTKDLVFIHGLQCSCVIGVWPWEKKITQTLVLDIDLATDASKAAASDELADAPDYQAIANRITEHAEASRVDLIETLAEQIAQIILTEFKVPWVRIRIDKGGVLKGAKQVGVVIERSSST